MLYPGVCGPVSGPEPGALHRSNGATRHLPRGMIGRTVKETGAEEAQRKSGREMVRRHEYIWVVYQAGNISYLFFRKLNVSAACLRGICTCLPKNYRAISWNNFTLDSLWNESTNERTCFNLKY